jgi:hypothetical protein
VRRKSLALALLSLRLLGTPPVEAAEPITAAGPPVEIPVDAEGRRHGSYHKDGVIAVRGVCRQGKLHGLHRTYNMAGRLVVQKTYRGGEQHGSWKALHANKRLKLTATYEQVRARLRITFARPREGRSVARVSESRPEGRAGPSWKWRAWRWSSSWAALHSWHRASTWAYASSCLPWPDARRCDAS